ncbi:MAG: DegV family protein [Candidatus Paceibacterota bacterium]|jgi:DegV family protein with EDD domain
MMKRIGIVTEETANLPPDIIEKYRIAVVPVKLDWPDIENLPGENTFQKMREAEKRGIKSFGKTSQPSIKDYLDKYKQQLAGFEKVICVSLGSKFSGSYNSAIQAKNFLKPDEQGRIFNMDSANNSGGQGLAVLKTEEMIEQGISAPEILEKMKSVLKNIKFFVIMKDYKWIEYSGRISHLAGIILSKMAKSGLRPLLTIKNGKLSPAGIKSNAKDFPSVLFGQLKSEIEKKKMLGGKIKAAIIHGDDPLGAERLREMIKKDLKNVEIVFLNLADNVNGVVSGPDAMVLAWIED